MKKSIRLWSVAAALSLAGLVRAETNAVAAAQPVGLAATLTVARCQAVGEDGVQCPAQASDGESFCWRHRGLVKAGREAGVAVGEGAGKAWDATKSWSTNAWDKTKDWSTNAWDSTKHGAHEAWDATKRGADRLRRWLSNEPGDEDKSSKAK